MLNNHSVADVRSLSLVLVSLVLLTCHPPETKTVKPIPAPEFEHSPGCELQGRTVELDLEISPGLRLLRITGLPPRSTDQPDWEVLIHWMHVGFCDIDSDGEIFISVKNQFGSALVGYQRLSTIGLSPTFWKQDVCVPVPCSIELPIGSFPTKWELHLRVRMGFGQARGFPLVVVRLG
jgi:hypothetical protein